MRDHHTWLLDLDGVIYRGNVLLPGARELVEWLDGTGRKVVYLSNNSFATPAEVAAKLARLGMPHPEGRVVTAGMAAIEEIARRYPNGRVYVLGVPSVRGMVETAGLKAVWDEREDGPAPDVVLSALDRNLTYDRLSRGLRAILAGAAFISVNRDPRLPVEHGFEPGTGAITASLEYASGIRAEIIGKPAPGIVLSTLTSLGSSVDDTLMVGDGLDLDIVAGRAAGVTTALVLTGLTSRAEAEAARDQRQPDYVFPDLPALLTSARSAAGEG